MEELSVLFFQKTRNGERTWALVTNLKDSIERALSPGVRKVTSAGSTESAKLRQEQELSQQKCAIAELSVGTRHGLRTLRLA